MNDCFYCCNMNNYSKSNIPNTKKFCDQIIYQPDGNFWLEQNKYYNRSLAYQKKMLNSSKKNNKYCVDHKCKYIDQKKNVPEKQYIQADKYFSSYDEYLSYQRSNEIASSFLVPTDSGKHWKNNKNPTPFIANSYYK